MRSHRLTTTILTVGLTLLGAVAQPSARFERLYAMPPTERLRLARKLAEFDALPTAEQARIREIDRQLQALGPIERQRYLRLMRDYNLWLRDQPRAVRLPLQQADPDARIKLINAIQAHQRKERDRFDQRARVFGDRLQVSTLGSEPLLLSALQLQFWFSLEPERRAKIQKPLNPRRQREAFLRAVQASEDFSRFGQAIFPRFRSVQKAERREEILTDALRRRLRGGQIPVKADNILRRLEIGRLKNLEEPRVDPDHLAAFEKRMPPWVRESLDPFPPDSAERRLRILYRMVFPPCEEISTTSDNATVKPL